MSEPAPPSPAPVPPAPPSEAWRVLAWLARDLLSVPFHLVVFLFTADHHRRRLREALQEGER